MKASIQAWLTAVAFMSAGAVPAKASGLAFQIGVEGWALETFGTDVAVLRAPVSTTRAAGGQVGVLLSCSGSDRRVRLSFPTPIAGVPTETHTGSALFAETGKRDDPLRVATRFSLFGPSTLVVSASAASKTDVVRTIAQMLLAKPAGLELLVHLGTEPIAFMKVLSYRLFLSFGAMDGLAVDRFLDACDRAKAKDAG